MDIVDFYKILSELNLLLDLKQPTTEERKKINKLWSLVEDHRSEFGVV